MWPFSLLVRGSLHRSGLPSQLLAIFYKVSSLTIITEITLIILGVDNLIYMIGPGVLVPTVGVVSGASCVPAVIGRLSVT